MSVPGRPPEAGDGPGPVEQGVSGAGAAPGPGTWGLTFTEPWYLGALYDLISDVYAATGGPR